MAKVRIFEWAKTKGLKSNEVVKKLQQEGHKVRNHTAMIEEEILNGIFKEKTVVKKEKDEKITTKIKDNKKEKIQDKKNEEIKKARENKKFNKQMESLPESEEKKPTSNKKGKGKTKEVDRFAIFDEKENDKAFDQKTRTQLKKEMRLEREKERANEQVEVVWTDDMTVNKFATAINIPVNDIITKLFELGIMATINQVIDKDSAEILCADYNVLIVEDESNAEIEFENLIPKYDESIKVKRPPIVTIMGHVDHGKTTLLDTLRKSNITQKESGGITQHIGAYQIEKNGNKITFLDTPGHAAFSAMRSRGADITDITILVVAADDGVMPQTKEAIAHAKEAKTPIIVAVNKMDKEGANPERVMSELAELQILAEEWGGDVPFVKISAKNGDGIDELISYIEMLADLHDYKAASNVLGYGTVIEAHLDKGFGPVATIIVEEGEVNLQDPIVIGDTWGSIRKLEDENKKTHKKVVASQPIRIMGLKAIPNAGDKFVVMEDIKKAQEIGEKRASLKEQRERNNQHAMSLEELNMKIAEGSIKELPIIIKADTQGSVEALASSLEKIEVNGVKARVIYKGIGAINESDVMLALTSNAIIIGFNTRPDSIARALIQTEKIELLLNNVIYSIIEEIEDAMNGMRDKKYREEIIGLADVLEIFKISGVGKVLGCQVTQGKITREAKIRLIRDGIVIYDGEIGELKRHKDSVKEVVEGMDFGMSFKDFDDIKKNDQVEAYILEEEIEN